MSSFIKSGNLAKLCLKNNKILLTPVRHHWNKDFKPALYPKTEQERKQAAEKYNLHPSEYKPYPDDGMNGWGDYPQLPAISSESKDPFYPWDNPELKRNYKETLHADFDLMREDRYDVSAKLRIPGWAHWAWFLGVMSSTFLLYYVLEEVKMFHPLVARQYPGDGKKHYTFEQNE